MFGFDPYSPRTIYNPAAMRGSLYNTNPSASAYSRDHLARDRYVRALQEQQAARQAYADALAQREVQRLEDEYAADPYARAVPRSAGQYLTGYNDDDDEEDYNERLRAQYIMKQKEQQRAALERRREQQLLAEQERQAALEAEAARRAAIEARRARQHAQYEADQQALEEERLRRAQRYYNQHPARQGQQSQPATAPVEQEPTAVRVPIRSSTPPAPTTSAPPQPDPESSALEAISKISSAASDLRKSFQLPPSIDFVDSSDKPTLSYASTNRPIRAYEDAMSKLLEKLDAVESAGVTEIREARRRVVKEIEGALQELEGQVEGIWRKGHMQDEIKEVGGDSAEASSAGDQEEADAMPLDEEPVGQDDDTVYPAASGSEPSGTVPTAEMASEPDTAPRPELASDSSASPGIEATEPLAETPSHPGADTVDSQESKATSPAAVSKAAEDIIPASAEGQQPPAAAQRDPWSTFDLIV